MAVSQLSCPLQKVGGPITTAQHENILQRVKDLTLIDPSDLLAKHRYLLQADFVELGEASSGMRLNWIASVESATAAAEYVRSGRKVWGEPGSFAPTRQARATPALRSSSAGSLVYRRRRVRGTRRSLGND